MPSIHGLEDFNQFIFGMRAMETTLSAEVTNKALEHGLKIVLHEQQKMFGKYPGNTGTYPRWAKLTSETQDAREKHGFSRNQPLLANGDLKESWTVGRDATSGVPGIGSDSPYAFIHELGGQAGKNATIPQRSTLGVAFQRVEKKAFLAVLEYIESRMALKAAAMQSMRVNL